MKKITILGVTASGKTTLANKLGEILNIPVIHLDKIFWKEKGGIKQDQFVIEVEKIMNDNDEWIIEGSMPRSKTLDMRLANADTIILFDMPLYFVLWRQTKRFFKYYNKVRPDTADDNKQKYPFTWKEFRHALNYPIKDLRAKIQLYRKNKKVVIINNTKDETSFLGSIN